MFLTALLMAVVIVVAAIGQTPHASITRMQRMSRHAHNHLAILQDARGSHAAFEDYYGDIAGGVRALQQTRINGLSVLKQTDYLTSTSGILNRIFGSYAWAQLNILAPTWGALPKSQRSRNSPFGWRAKTAFASTGKGGQSQGTIPTAVVGSYTEVSPTPKESSIQMRVTGLHQDMYEIDDAYGSLRDLNGEVQIEHLKEMERALTEDIDTTAGNNLESVDRLTASSANQAAIGWTAGDEDIFGIDRSANTWANAQQSAAATARALTRALIKGRLTQAIKAGGQPTFWLTGYETWEAIDSLHDAQGRTDVNVGRILNGKQGDADVAEGMQISTLVGEYLGRPIILSDQIEIDSTELPRLYLLDISNPEGQDKPRTGLDIIRPTTVYTAGERTNGMPQAIGLLGDSVLAVTRAELGSRGLPFNAQLRDITSPA